jgi:hypothetical protein
MIAGKAAFVYSENGKSPTTNRAPHIADGQTVTSNTSLPFRALCVNSDVA